MAGGDKLATSLTLSSLEAERLCVRMWAWLQVPTHKHLTAKWPRLPESGVTMTPAEWPPGDVVEVCVFRPDKEGNLRLLRYYVPSGCRCIYVDDKDVWCFAPHNGTGEIVQFNAVLVEELEGSGAVPCSRAS